MISVSEARDLVSRSFSSLPTELVSVREAVGRVVAEDLQVREDSPSFDNSAMDGFAVRFADLENLPRNLDLAFEIPAGSKQTLALPSGKAARVFTGAMIPEDADTVIMQEDVEIFEKSIQVFSKPVCGAHIRTRGEDLMRGNRLLARGEILSAPMTALLASQGIYKVEVYQKPSLAFIMSGNELCFEGQTLEAGMIRSSNGELFSSMLQSHCSEIVDYGWVGDDPQHIRAKVALAEHHDIFLISGGASVGKYDYTKSVIEELGYQIHFEKIAMRPGKPLIFATRGQSAIFGIPGNPVSAYVGCFLFVMDALYALTGKKRMRKRLIASLGNDVKKPPQLEMYQRGNLVQENLNQKVYTNLNQSSGALGALARADCLVALPAGVESVRQGEPVEVLPFYDCEYWN